MENHISNISVKFQMGGVHSSGVMASVLCLSVVNSEFASLSVQAKDYHKIGICCFSAKPQYLRSWSKDWLARNPDNVSEWSVMSTHGLLFQ